MHSLLFALLLAAADGPVPGTRYDPAIPTLQQVLGYEQGAVITPPAEVERYLKALAAAAPTRTRLVRYAESWEGRPLSVLVVASADRIAQLEKTQAGLRRLADPRGLAPAEADRLISELPVVTWLIHAVHGDEISSSDAALAEAYHLLAATGDPTVDAILKSSVVLIDPLQNPDGRARFIASNSQGRAAEPDTERLAAERDQPWPGGRYNHYLFDMNRDWFALTQPETQGRVRFFLDWRPQVVVDLHEMGGDSTYYFAPPAAPANPHLTPLQQHWLETFGRANAESFDAHGYAYFIREVYDAFYPGYGDSWPFLQGGIGMTFEQASARGLLYRRRDDTLLSYRQSILQHFTSALTTLATAAHNREAILRDFLAVRRAGIADGHGEYLLPPGTDPPRTERLARLLAAQGIDVRRADAAFKLDGAALPAGTFVVPRDQPALPLVRNLLETQIALEPAFLREQDRRRQKRLPDQIYDVTAWSLPLLWDVELIASDHPTLVHETPLPAAATEPAALALTPARVGYALPWGVGTAGVVVKALAAGVRVRSADEPLTLAGRRFAAGTAFVRTSENTPEQLALLGRLVASAGVTAVPLDSGWSDAGISLGSRRVQQLKAPRVLLAWDDPTDASSAGWARFVLERRYEQRVTAVRTGSLGAVDLSHFDVLVLPEGDYADRLSDGTAKKLKAWVRGGGTLITLGEATRWAAREKVGLLETHTEMRDGTAEVEEKDEGDKKEGKKDPPAASSFDFDKAIQPEHELPENVTGALLRVALDPDHWLCAGADGEISVVSTGQRVLTPIKLDHGTNVGVYAAKDRLVASGLVWPEEQARRARKAYLIEQPLGEGHVVAFAEDPNFRGFAEASELLFINAVLLGPAH